MLRLHSGQGVWGQEGNSLGRRAWVTTTEGQFCLFCPVGRKLKRGRLEGADSLEANSSQRRAEQTAGQLGQEQQEAPSRTPARWSSGLETGVIFSTGPSADVT